MKKSNTLRGWAAVVTLTMPLAACTTMTSIRRHPEFAARRPQISAVAVVPPELKFTLVTFKGDNQPLTEDEANVRSWLAAALASEIATRGFTVRDVATLAAREGQSPEVRFQTSQANASYLQIARESYAKGFQMASPQAESYQRSLGPAVQTLGNLAAAEALVFAQMEGFKKSGGEVAKDVALSVLLAAVTGTVVIRPTQGAVLTVAFVDARTGDVLWQNAAATQSDFATPGVAQGMVRQVFTPFPTGSSAPATTLASAPAPTVVSAPAPAAERPAAPSAYGAPASFSAPEPHGYVAAAPAPAAPQQPAAQ